VQRSHPALRVAIYCGEMCTPEALSRQASSLFNVHVEPTFFVVPLRRRRLLEPASYPRLTVMMQALGSMRVACDALSILVPELWIDTTGWAFPYPLVQLAGSKIAAYVHYPTVSSNMAARVRMEATAAGARPGAWVKCSAKLAYYWALMRAYGACGGAADVVMTNSSWTRRHIEELWWRCAPSRVYPPCDVESLAALPLDRRLKRLYVASVAQFRPEKRHDLQLRAWAAARAAAAAAPAAPSSNAVLMARLYMVGGCRDADDRARMESLRSLAVDLSILSSVEFMPDLPFADLRALLGEAVAGLHAMEDEHFGIGMVEYMAAGLVPIAHDSGGPREDIVVPEPGGPSGQGQRVGWLCSSQEEYAAALTEVLGMEQVARLRVAAAARRRAGRFNDARFQEEWLSCLAPVLPQEDGRRGAQ
jgi:alpha-1,2-mannosyltransferase